MAQRFTTTRRTGGGYTLLELLVVIAITTILLGLIFGPLIQSFNMVGRANAVSVAQDAVRLSMERMTREISRAAYIYDNSNAPVLLPIGAKPGVNEPGTSNPLPAGYKAPFLFAKLDLIPAATLPAPGPEDPTTGGSVNGDRLVFPLVSGTRVVRYFIGLRDNGVESDGSDRTYQNVYEFSGDRGLNPFVLYRAEIPAAGDAAKDFFDPTVDLKIIDPNTGGFNDPNFFYNRDASKTLNGKSYAENWKAVASPVLSGDRIDVLAWSRNARRQISQSAPFRTIVSFQPAAVVGDTATPGYLTDTGNETPNAVPSVYSAENGLWVAPYTVTVYRGSNQQRTGHSDPDRNTFGALRIIVEREGNDLKVRSDYSSGTLGIGSSSLFWQQDPDSGNLLIDAGNRVTFVIDPRRGRIVTGLPSMAYNSAGDSLITTLFRINARHPDAGTSRPANAGRLYLQLDTANYYPTATSFLGTETDGGGMESPLKKFQGLVVPGSERVLGPPAIRTRQDPNGNATTDPDGTTLQQAPYHRIPAVELLTGADSQTGAVDGATQFLNPPTGSLSYHLDTDLDPIHPRIVFQESTSPLAQGLWAARASSAAQKYVAVNFLWQNNFARRPSDGTPVDIWGTPVAGRSAAPEADVVKVDYATRSLINVTLGVRVYDASNRVPQTVQVIDRIKVNNPTR